MSIAASRQLIEIASWRVATEMVRRYPRRLRVYETHPGGGQYDCLTLVNTTPAPKVVSHIDLNRAGSAHIWMPEEAGPTTSWEDFWRDFVTAEDPREVVDKLAKLARLPPVDKPPHGTAGVLVYRVIAAFLAHNTFGRVRWECRNGFCDTSGGVGGMREDWFASFPATRERLQVRQKGDPAGGPAYRFWFLLNGDRPQVCFETTGFAWDRRGTKHDLAALYRPSRRIWPLVVAVAGDLLP